MKTVNDKNLNKQIKSYEKAINKSSKKIKAYMKIIDLLEKKKQKTIKSPNTDSDKPIR